MALPLILSSSCIACTFLPLCLPCLPSALASVNITTNYTLDAGVLGLIIRVSEALNFNIRAFLKANNFLLEAGDCKISSFKIPSFLNSSFLEVSRSPLKAGESGIGSSGTSSFPNSSLLKISRSFFKVALPYIRCLLRLL